MKEYKKILEFIYKKQKYNMYLDKNNKRFFMKILSNGELSYLTDEELINILQLFVKNTDILKVENSKISFVPKIITSAGAVLLTTSVLLNSLSTFKENAIISSDKYASIQNLDSDDLNRCISLSDNVVSDDYYYDSENNYLYIYGEDYIDDVLGSEKVTIDNLKEAILENENISFEYKALLNEYCDRLVSKYPDADFRMFYNNLKTLKITECTEQEMQSIIGDSNCSGFYIRSKNGIYVLEGNNYEEGSWDFQVLYHELTHVVRNSKFDVNEMHVSIQIEDQKFDNNITHEALTTLFALSLFNYEEYDRSYQTPSNYYAVMAECMDYDFTDYINEPLSDFPEQLNKYNGDDEGTAESILELIQMQYECYQNSDLEIDENEFDSIIDYLCNMYFKKYITEDMTYDESYGIATELINKISLNTFRDYPLNLSRVYENLDNYLYSYENDNPKSF